MIPTCARQRLAGAILASSLALAACASYEPKPIDLLAHRDGFVARLPAPTQLAAIGSQGAASASPAVELADGVSPYEGELIALVFNPDLRLARAKLGVAEATRSTAGLWDDPVLAADIAKIVPSVAEPWTYGISLGFTLPISGRLAAAQAVADLATQLELRRVAEAEWATRLAVREAWVRWSTLRARAALARELLARIEEVGRIATRLEAAGELSRVEARLFRMEETSQRRACSQLDAATVDAELALRALLGLAPEAPLAFQPTVECPTLPSDRAGRTALLLERDETIAVAQAAYEVAEAELAREIREQYPDLTIAPGGGADQGPGQVLLGLSLPLPFWNRNQAGVAIALAERHHAGVVLETTVEARHGELARRETRLAAATVDRQLLEADLVPLAEAEYAEARRIAELGEMNTVVLLDALARDVEARNALLEAHEREAVAGLAVLALLGPAPSDRRSAP